MTAMSDKITLIIAEQVMFLIKYLTIDNKYLKCLKVNATVEFGSN